MRPETSHQLRIIQWGFAIENEAGRTTKRWHVYRHWCAENNLMWVEIFIFHCDLPVIGECSLCGAHCCEDHLLSKLVRRGYVS